MGREEPDVPVDHRLCLALYQASHAMDSLYRVLLDGHGLTYTQYTVLSLLAQDGPASVTSLARRLSLSSNTLSPLLKRMEQQGRVTRRRSAQDERTVLVDLAPEGRLLADELGDVQRDVTAATGLGADEQDDLVDVLGRLAGSLRKAADEGQR
ncbi:MarR family winged helix-turn-helix transcriptional regulator [Pseudokineococcus sp. 1T1Z-3]|uniref:MarR family winged helix-turn-helix transcriptional regulator n=1 Tax=Pseudokineococcus sp. 1T1Z-3 TaxID=3132745 RepID=UPI0030B535A2